MIVGFTGSREGMTERQAERVHLGMIRLGPIAFHHGDCVGSDEEMHMWTAWLDPPPHVFVHPPSDDRLRAWCMPRSGRGAVLEPLGYHERNREIVDCSRVLVAAPNGPQENRSGTWSTIRYAWSRKRKTFIVMPNGSVLS